MGVEEAQLEHILGIGQLVPINILDYDKKVSMSTSYEGADINSREIGLWRPYLCTADQAIIPERREIHSRSLDLTRNNPIASGAVQTLVDNVVGDGLRLSAKPDYQALGLSREWALEWGNQVEVAFRQWSEDVDLYCDVTRRNNLYDMQRIVYKSILLSGEALVSAEWLNRSTYSTTLRIIDTDRLSNPNFRIDDNKIRGGVEFNRFGEPIAYHIRARSEDFKASSVWKRIKKEHPWGRQKILHIFDSERADQSRGMSKFASNIMSLKMLDRFEKSTLETQVFNAAYAAVIESEYQSSEAFNAIGAMSQDEDPTQKYILDSSAFHEGANVKYNGTKIPHLFPGEKFKLITSNHPGADFSTFEEAVLRHVASGFDLSYEMLARDYSKVNFASAQSAKQDAIISFRAKKQLLNSQFNRQVYALWLEEAMDKNFIPVPAKSPSFQSAKSAWTKSEWLGAGRGHTDPLKEEKSQKLCLEMGTTTLEQLCAAKGLKWDEVLDQQALELARKRQLGLTE